MNRSALACAVVLMLAGCGGTVPLLGEVDAEDSSSEGSVSEASDLDAMPGDDATTEGSAEGSPDVTIDQVVPPQDALAEVSDGPNDAAADVASEATVDATRDGAGDAASDADADADTDAAADAPCTPGVVVCGPGGYQIECQSSDGGGWAPYTQGCFCGYLCDPDGGVTCGGIAATCAVNARQCSGNAIGSCDPFGPGICGVWRVSPPCVNQTCVGGVCTGVCAPGSTQCSSNGVQTCMATGTWSTAVPCDGGTCAGGACNSSADAAAD